MQYSPKLKMAAEEIKEILKKHDIGAIVVLHTPGFGEYIYKIDPSYSCAELHKNSIRFKLKASLHYHGNTAKRDKMVTDTTNMFKILSDLSAMMAGNTHGASNMLDTALSAEHTRGDHSSHNDQNN